MSDDQDVRIVRHYHKEENMSWIRRSEDVKVNDRQAVQNGPGHMISQSLAENDGELNDKGRLLAHNTLNKNCGVGWHVHEGDTEIYIILKGEAEYNDNGTITTVKAGDVTFTDDGEGHSITNKKDEPVEFIALILYK